MFNALSTAEVVLAVGRVTRAAARVEDGGDEYHRSQLLSAYSVGRHLAAEENARRELLDWFTPAVAAALDEPAAQAVRNAREPAALGTVLADELIRLRADPAQGDRRRALHALLREMADREVAALAEPPR